MVRSRGDYIEWILETLFSFLFSFPILCSLLPQSLKKTWILIKTLQTVEFNVWKMFDQLGCDKIYEVNLEFTLRSILEIFTSLGSGQGCLLREVSRHQRPRHRDLQEVRGEKNNKFRTKYALWCRSERLAAELGCAYTYAGVTGVYSQKIFTKLEHTTLKSLNYADFRDEKGELYLKDTREHTKIVTCVKKLIE